MLTQERSDKLTKFLEEDIERTKKLFEMEAADAVKVINESGYDFTADELLEYGKAIQAVASKGELNEGDLENVSGGVISVSIGIMIACGAGGAVAGFLASKW